MSEVEFKLPIAASPAQTESQVLVASQATGTGSVSVRFDPAGRKLLVDGTGTMLARVISQEPDETYTLQFYLPDGTLDGAPSSGFSIQQVDLGIPEAPEDVGSLSVAEVLSVNGATYTVSPMDGSDSPEELSAEVEEINLGGNVAQEFVASVNDKTGIVVLEAADVGARKLLNFTYDEQDTGMLWTDNHKIYQKTVNCGAMPNNSNKIVPHLIPNVEYIIRMWGMAVSLDSGATIPLPYVHFSEMGAQIQLAATRDHIELHAVYDLSIFDASRVTLWYTCFDR